MTGHTALFRFDAGPEIGGGHAVRCFTLARELEARGWTCRFAVGPETLKTVGSLADRAAECVAPDDMAVLTPVTVVIVDHYGLDIGDEKPWREIARHIVALDDLANRRHDCDVLIDQGLGRRAGDYAGLVPPECRLLLGPLYGLLRPEFAAMRETGLATRRPATVRRVLVAFGLSDPDNLTARALEGLAGKGLQVDVVLGAGAPHLDAVRNTAAVMSPPARVLCDVDDIAGLMVEADLAIGAFGTTSWERCALGLPTIGVIATDNQRDNARTLRDAGAALSLAWHAEVTAKDFANAVGRPLDLADMSRRAAQLCDGLGTGRVAGIIGDLAEGHSPSLRSATMADADLLLLWRNDQETRRQSKATNLVERAGHLSWLEGVLANPNRDIRVAEVNGRPVGSVRADRIGDTWMLSWMVAPEARGQGFGQRIVARVLEDLDGEIQAEVRVENRASARIASAVGMTPRDETDGLTTWIMRK